MPAAAAAAPSPPPPPILKLVNAIVEATNTDNASALTGLYTNDAVVVDENAPFAWRGADAGAAWWHAVDAVLAKMKLTHLKATVVRVGEFQQSPTVAYLIEALSLTGRAAGKPFAESGTFTYTFRKAAGHWLISSQVWTTKP